MKFIDGATMMMYQLPHKIFETVYCRLNPIPDTCESYRGINPNLQSSPLDAFEAKDSPIEGAGLGIFARKDIQMGDALPVVWGTDPVYVLPKTYEILKNMENTWDHEDSSEQNLYVFIDYVWFYGFEGNTKGGSEYIVEASIGAFANHGCNASYNYGPDMEADDMMELINESYPDIEASIDKVKNRDDVEMYGFMFDPVIEHNLIQYVMTNI